MNQSSSISDVKAGRTGLMWLLLVLGLVLAILFSNSFKPEQAHFANDGPLGAQASRIYDMPGAFFGIWSDLYWVGSTGGNYTANFTGILLWVLGPIGFNKFIVPSALLILGLSAGLFFRQLKLKPTVCILAGLAAALNSNYVSNACWGLPSRALALAAMFLALAAVESSFASRPFIKVIKIILAGLAIGLSVSEGGDNGAIFSLFFAGYVFWITWQRSGPAEGPLRRLGKATGKLAVIVVFAFLLAVQIVDIFFGLTGSGIAELGQKGSTKEEKWFAATQWSLPKMESLRVIIPGLYGYRLDTPNGGNYWGAVGQDAGWEQGHNDPEWVRGHFARHSGSGEYAGVMVVLIAFWTLFQAFANKGIFKDGERKMIWFWGGAALISLLLSWGRHAPFYQFVYALPYFSTIRNPMKFMHPFHLSLMILFAYGLQGMWRRYLESPPGSATKVTARADQSLEKKWMIGSFAAVLLAGVAFLIVVSSRAKLASHISELGFDPQQAAEMARFSAGEVGWFAFYLAVSVAVVWMVSKGVFAGAARAKWAGIIIGIILVTDLARANKPWIQYYDYKEKYANNGVFEVLSNQAHEHRVSIPAFQGDRNFSTFQQIYGVEWLQHQFPFYNIQALDQPQEPRMPADKAAYRQALGSNFVRLWELTNTRFVCGMAAGFVDALNQQLDPVQRRFKLHTRFNFFQNPGTGTIGARVEENGVFALIEFTGALPRAKLYSQWEVSTNAQSTLAKLADPTFDPAKTVLVFDPIAPPPAATSNVVPGTVEFTHYEPKHIELKVGASTPSVLLLNDKFDAGWKVSIDGRPGAMVRCNFLMRGVQVPPGNHTVAFRFQPHSAIFYVALGATIFGLLLCGFVWFDCWRGGYRSAQPE